VSASTQPDTSPTQRLMTSTSPADFASG
jgi:hypothetical protein